MAEDRLKQTELFLLDMDGTLYLGDKVIDGAIEFLELLAQKNRRYIYLTNNSSRAGEDYVSRLRALGFPCEQENIFTSGMATAMYLREKYPDGSVFAVGTRAFRRELLSYGVKLADEGNADAVAVGFDRELTYAKLERACDLLRDGAHFIAANPDLVCPMDGGRYIPDCGSICALLTAATGRQPYYIGKPNRNMVDIISKRTGIPNDRIAAVGDRLYTDIAVAKNAGGIGICVLSGETTREMIDVSAVQPDYVFESVRELGQRL